MYRVRATVGATATALVICLAGSAHADPAEPTVPAEPVGGAPADVNPVEQSAPLAVGSDAGDPVQAACKQFNAAVTVAATNYEDFAYATAGNGNVVNYDDPTVEQSNVVGRSALRVAAGAALDASRTPGLPPEVADPMQDYSLHATKLLVVMGLRGGGDRLNSSATQLNSDATDAQMACALALAPR